MNSNTSLVEVESPSKILVVDDNTANIDVMLSFLEVEGYDISIATDGETAVRVANHNHPDLILLDVMMPGIDGYETCRRLKKQPATQTIPIIFVTAKKEVDDIVQGFNSGGVDYISKPFRKQEVLSRIGTHLRLQFLAATQEKLIERLNQALAKVKTLEGLLSICSSCKKIRDKNGAWHSIESYISKRTDVEFSHGICMECAAKLYPDFDFDDS